MDMKIEEIRRGIEKIRMGTEEEIPMEIDPWDDNLSSEQVHHSLDDYYNYYPNYDPHKTNTSALKIDLFQVLKSWDYHISKEYNHPEIGARNNARGLISIILVEKYHYRHDKNLPIIRHNKENLQKLFDTFNCDVKICSNTTSEGIDKELNELSQAHGFDFFSIFICGHGELNQNGEEILHCSDYQDRTLNGTLKIIDIVKKFSVNNCPNWASKLKVFAIDICRVGPNYNQETTNGFQSLIKNKNDFLDMLIVFGTKKNSVSYYTPNGSIFYDLLCDVIYKTATNTHFTDMFKKAESRMAHEIIPNHPKESLLPDQYVDILETPMTSKPIYFNPINEKVYNRLIALILPLSTLFLILLYMIIIVCLLVFVVATKNDSEKTDFTKKLVEPIESIFILKCVYEHFTAQNFLKSYFHEWKKNL